MKKSNIIQVVMIGISFVILIAVNKNNYVSIVQTISGKWQENTEIKAKESISSILKDNFSYRNKFMDLYGITKKTLGDRIIGNYEYVKDESGIMQHILPTTETNNYLSSMKSLMGRLNERNIPCIDVNLPDRGKYFSGSNDFAYNCKRYRDVEDALISFGIDEFNVQEKVVDSGSIAHNDFFFHTDVHLTTQAEFLMAKNLTEYLTEKYSLNFPSSDVIYNYNSYTWQNHEFSGNFCGSSGKRFTRTDIFQTFLPKYDVEMKLTTSGGGQKQGGFVEVMTNQYTDEASYWVTEYGQWPGLYYTYENLKYPDAPKLLVVADSMFLRANTFLALNSSKLTVFDPRYINGNEYIVDCLLDEDYDAVIICHTDYFNNNLFLSDINLPEKIIPCTETSYNGMFIDIVNDRNFNSNGISQGEIPKSIIDNSEIITFNGWAADFNSNMPLSALYLKAGDKTVKCQYGTERASVSDHYYNENLKMTGFNVSIPKSYLDNVNTVEFIMVGNDGTYRFESVPYTITG